jgi:hypothetical protein
VRKGRFRLFRSAERGKSAASSRKGRHRFSDERTELFRVRLKTHILLFGHDIRSFPNLKRIACGLFGPEGAADGIWRSAVGCGQLSRCGASMVRRIEGFHHLDYLDFSNF